MTKEEILSLKPGRELDILIAEKVLDWRRVEGPHYDYNGPCEYGDVLIPPDMSEDEAFTMMPSKGKVPFDYFITRKYSTNISDAWEVIEKFPWYEIERNGAAIWCMLMNKKRKIYIGYGDTVPEAICKAALMAKEKF